jgi:hypothetical protein
MDEGRSVIDRTLTAPEQHAAGIAKLNELLQAGAIDQTAYAHAVEDANDRALRSVSRAQYGDCSSGLGWASAGSCSA